MIPQEQFFQLIKIGALEQVKSALDEDPSLVNARSSDGISAPMLAAYYQHPAVARLLAKYGSELDLFEASAIGLLDQVEQILSKEPEKVDEFASDGFQALGLACFFGHLEVVRTLLAHGARTDMAARNPMKVMPLHSAAAGRNSEIVQLLIERGAAVNERQADDFTPLHAAAQNGDLAIIRLLLEAGADPNLRDAEAKTALTFALVEAQTQAVELLRSFGAIE